MLIVHKIFERQHFANPFDGQKAHFLGVVTVQLLAYRQLNIFLYFQIIILEYVLFIGQESLSVW